MSSFSSHPARYLSLIRAAVLGGCLIALPMPPAARAQAAAGADATALPESINYANGLLRERHYAQAAEEYERFLQESPESTFAADAHYGLARARLFQNKPNYEEARRHYREFLKLAPQHPNAANALFRVGETSFMLNDLPAARKALEEFTAHHPGHRDLESAWPYLGDIYFQLEDYAAARKAYEQAISIAPQGRLVEAARYGLGLTLAAQGDAGAAVPVFTDLVSRNVAGWADKAQYQIGRLSLRDGKFPEAIEAFEAVERLYPTSPVLPEARLGKAEALARSGRHAEAEALLRPLLADPSPELAAQAAFNLGTSQFERNQPAEALATFDQALKKYPRTRYTAALLFRSAEAAQKLRQTSQAKARFLKMVEVAPKDLWADDALLRAAALALDAKDHASAQSLAASLSAKYPTSPLLAEAHLIEARARLATGQPKPAITLLTGLLNNDKPNAETAQAARYYLGQAYRADGQADKAAEILESLAKTPAAPVATDAQFLVGQEHFQAGRFAEAIGPLQKYLAGKPNGEVADHAMAYLALSQQAVGQVDAALETLQQLATRFPRSQTLAPTRLRLADALLSAKQYSQAADLYRQVTEVDDPKWKARALSGLGWALLQGGKPAEAAEAFSARLETQSDDALAAQDALARARALEVADRTDDALAAYEQVTQRYAQADQAANAILARARLLAKQKRPLEAAQAFSAYLQNPPKNAEGLDGVLAELGWAWLDAGKMAEADQAFQRLLDQFPDSLQAADARLNLAESAYEAKKHDEVVKLLEPVVAEGSKADPVVIQSALYRLGRTAVVLKDWPNVARWFDRLVTNYPESAFSLEAGFWKAEAAFQAGDAKSAEAEFSRLASTPSTPESLSLIQSARVRWVQSLILLGRWKEALSQADAFKAEWPNHSQMPEIEFARGRALQQTAQFDAARTAYQSVIEARKGGELAARAQLMIGETYFHQRNYNKALHELLKVEILYKEPTWQAAALLEAGKVYEQLAQWTEAAEIYKKLREKFPNDPRAAEAARRLDEVQKQASSPGNSAPTAANGSP